MIKSSVQELYVNPVLDMVMKEFIASFGRPIFFVTQNGEFLYVNQSFLDLFGYSDDDLERMKVEEMYADYKNGISVSRNEFINKLQKKENKHLIGYKLILRKSNGEAIICAVDSRVNYFNRQVIHMGTITDITKPVNKKRKLIQANKMLEQFAYQISHDIRSPLSVLYGYLNLLLDNRLFPNFPDDAIKYIETMIEQINELSKYVDNLLNLAKAGQKIGKRKKINLVSLIKDAFIQSKHPESNIKLIIDDSLPEVMADSVKIKQVFLNLINNSIKNRKDKTKLTIEVGDAENNDDYTTIYFKDNGVGIKKENLKKIFNTGISFQSNKKRSAGLGLAIVKKIIEAHGGKVWAESEGENKGAAFFIRLPKI